MVALIPNVGVTRSQFSSFGGVPDAPHLHALYDWCLSERIANCRYGASLPHPKKEFSKAVLTGEQTVDDRELGGKMVPNLQNKGFPPCGHADGGYVSV